MDGILLALLVLIAEINHLYQYPYIINLHSYIYFVADATIGIGVGVGFGALCIIVLVVLILGSVYRTRKRKTDAMMKNDDKKTTKIVTMDPVKK